MAPSTTIRKSESRTATCRVSAPQDSVPAEAFVRAMQRFVQSNRLEEGQKFLDQLNQSLAVEDVWPPIARELQAILSEAWERRSSRLAGPRDVTRNMLFFGDDTKYTENTKADDTLWSAG